MLLHESKPVKGRGIVEGQQFNSNVTRCGSKHCKTCFHLVEGDSFTSNITNIKYSVVSRNSDMDCSTRNVIYLITCRKCGVQYVGKTSPTLRCRLNNHHNRLKQLCDLYLYNHFNSDRHSLDDILLMPIEEVSLSQKDNISLSSKLLLREEFWYRELCCVYPYGLNDNVNQFDYVSKISNSFVVYSLFNKQKRRYDKGRRQRKKHNVDINVRRLQFIILIYYQHFLLIFEPSYLHYLERSCTWSGILLKIF